MALPALPDEDEVIGTINTTPLVDVMLVLLIIFLITIPVVTTSVPVQLPRESTQPRQTQPENVLISVDRDGRIYLYDTPVADARALQERMRSYARMAPQPDVQIRGDADSAFAAISRVLQAVQAAGISRVGFVTEPQN